MDSPLQSRGNAIYQDTSTDLSASIGKLVTFTAGVPAVNASTTVAAVGVVLDSIKRQPNPAATPYYESAIGILGCLPGPIWGMVSASSAALNFGDSVQQAADGTLTKDLGAGNGRVVVGICTDKSGGNPGSACEFTLFTPQIRS